MPVGVGGLLTDALGGDLNAQMARALAGPQPNPQASPSPTGAPGGSSAAPGGGQPSAATPAPGQTPAQTYAPDPQNASTIDLLLKVHQQDLAASGINRGLSQMAASFGTAEQQKSKMAALDQMAGPQDDRLAALKQIQGIQQEQFQQQQQRQFAAGAAGMAGMLNISPDQARWLATNPTMMNEVLATHFRDMSPTEQQKNVEAYGKSYAAQQGYDPDPSKWTPQQQQDVASHKAGMLASTIGNLDPAQREMQQASAAWDQANRGNSNAVKPPYLTDITQWKAHQDVVSNAQKDLTTEKNQFDTNDAKAAHLESTLDALSKDKAALDATVSAVRDSTLRSEGPAARYLPKALGGEDQTVIDARNNLNTLMNELSSQNLQGFSRMAYAEFQRLAQSVSNLNQQSLSPEQIQTEIGRLTDQAKRMRANIQAQAGKTLDAQHSGFADPQYFDQNDPFYSHATIAKNAPQPGSMGSGASSSGAGSQSSPTAPQGPVDLRQSKDPDSDYAKLPSGAIFIGPDGKQRRKP